MSGTTYTDPTPDPDPINECKKVPFCIQFNNGIQDGKKTQISEHTIYAVTNQGIKERFEFKGLQHTGGTLRQCFPQRDGNYRPNGYLGEFNHTPWLPNDNFTMSFVQRPLKSSNMVKLDTTGAPHLNVVSNAGSLFAGETFWCNADPVLVDGVLYGLYQYVITRPNVPKEVKAGDSWKSNLIIENVTTEYKVYVIEAPIQSGYGVWLHYYSFEIQSCSFTGPGYKYYHVTNSDDLSTGKNGNMYGSIDVKTNIQNPGKCTLTARSWVFPPPRIGPQYPRVIPKFAEVGGTIVYPSNIEYYPGCEGSPRVTFEWEYTSEAPRNQDIWIRCVKKYEA